MSLGPPGIKDTVVAQSRKVGRRRVVVETTGLPFGMCAQEIHQSSHGDDDDGDMRKGRLKEEKAARKGIHSTFVRGLPRTRLQQ
jgi:hypothetical protein